MLKVAEAVKHCSYGEKRYTTSRQTTFNAIFNL